MQHKGFTPICIFVCWCSATDAAHTRSRTEQIGRWAHIMQSGAPLKFVCMIEKFAESSLAETALRSGRVVYICLIGHLFGKKGAFRSRRSRCLCTSAADAQCGTVCGGGGRRALLALLHWLRAPLEMICCDFFHCCRLYGVDTLHRCRKLWLSHNSG
jgi:hypothetical protein